MASDGSKGTCVSQTHWATVLNCPRPRFWSWACAGAGSCVPAEVATPSSAAPLPTPPPRLLPGLQGGRCRRPREQAVKGMCVTWASPHQSCL